MNNAELQREYERARCRLVAALDEIKADKVEPGISFTALIDLLVDWSLQQGGKQTLWEVMSAMHGRIAELDYIELQRRVVCPSGN